MAALMGAGTFAVHQLRFALTFRHGTGDPMAMRGHGYLVPVAPVLVGLLLLAFAVGLARMARGATDPAPQVRRLWAGTSASLFAVYCGQESVEGMLTAGHPAGLQGVVGHGGWVALPLALAVGLAIALIMRGAAAASTLVAAGAPWRAPDCSSPEQAVLPPWIARTTCAGARNLAARGPPDVSV